MLNIDYYLLTKNGESIICVTHSECFFFFNICLRYIIKGSGYFYMNLVHGHREWKEAKRFRDGSGKVGARDGDGVRFHWDSAPLSKHVTSTKATIVR